MELPRPAPGPGELSVRVEAAGVNPFDAKIADGVLRPRPHTFPLVLGVDAAGVVESCGPAVTQFAVGDSVFGSFLHDPVGVGTYAEATVVPERNALARVPRELSFVEAAALPTAGMAALASLDALGLPTGATLVIVGASGGIGSFAVQLASARRIAVVAAVRPGAAPRMRGLGASETVDSEPDRLPARLRERYPGGVDGLIDVMSDGPRFARLAACVRSGGTAASTVYAAGTTRTSDSGARMVDMILEPTAALLERLAEAIVAERLTVPVERTVPLESAASALEELRAGRGAGKTVVAVGGGGLVRPDPISARAGPTRGPSAGPPAP